MSRCFAFGLALLIALATPPALPRALAGEAHVVDATITPAGPNLFTITATIRHDDEGWEHFANRFDVVAPNGQVLQQRMLFHPHIDEQPFTRSLERVMIPADVDRVIIRAHDSVHGLGGWQMTLEVPR